MKGILAGGAAELGLLLMPPAVGFVLGEDPLRQCAVRTGIGIDAESPERFVFGQNRAVVLLFEHGPGQVAFTRFAPRPGVAEDKLRQQVQACLFRPPVGDRDPHEDVFRIGLGVLNEDVEVAVVVEDPGIGQFILGIVMRPFGVGGPEQIVGELLLRVLVQPLEVGMSRRRVEVVVALLDVLAVISFRATQTEEPLLEDRILAIPHRQGEGEATLAVGQSEDAVLPPAIGSPDRLIMSEGSPDATIRRPILANGPPLPLRQVRPPSFPVGPGIAANFGGQALQFGAGHINRRQ